jgi:hypothetical protein
VRRQLPWRVRVRLRGERVIDRTAQWLIDRGRHELAVRLWRLFRLI